MTKEKLRAVAGPSRARGRGQGFQASGRAEALVVEGGWKEGDVGLEAAGFGRRWGYRQMCTGSLQRRNGSATETPPASAFLCTQDGRGGGLTKQPDFS